MNRHMSQYNIDEKVIKKRYDTLISLYNDEFIVGLGDLIAKKIILSKELLYCAVNTFFEDIYKDKMDSHADMPNRYKQAAYTMIWITRFKPIQIIDTLNLKSSLLTINQAFAIFAGLMFLDPIIIDNLTESFYDHLVNILTYGKLEGKLIESILYLMEKASQGGVKL